MAGRFIEEAFPQVVTEHLAPNGPPLAARTKTGAFDLGGLGEGASSKSSGGGATTGAEIANTMQRRPIFGQRSRPLDVARGVP